MRKHIIKNNLGLFDWISLWLTGSYWSVNPVTYQVTKYSSSGESKITEAQTDTEIDRAKTVNLWLNLN